MSKIVRGLSFENLLLGFTLLFMGFLVRYVPVPLTLIEEKIRQTSVYFDAFHYCRVQGLVIITILFAVAVVIELLLKERKLTADKWTYFFFAYILSITLSLILSPFPDLAFRGSADNYQGYVTLLCCAVFAYLLSLPSTKTSSERLLSTFSTIGFVILGVSSTVSIFQYWGFNVLNAPWLRSLTVSAQFANEADLFINSNVGYSFFGNPNYTSSVFVLFLPFVLYKAFTTSSRVQKSALVCLLLLGHIGMLSSLSLSAFLLAPIAYAVIFAMVSITSNNRKYALIIGGLLFLVSILFALLPNTQEQTKEIIASSCFWALATATWVLLSRRVSLKTLLLITSIATLLLGFAGFLFLKRNDDTPREILQSVNISSNRITIQTTNSAIEIRADKEVIQVFDQKGTVLHQAKFNNQEYQVRSSSTSFTITEATLSGYRVLTVKPFGIQFCLLDGTFRYVSSNGSLGTLDRPLIIGPLEWGAWGTGRGYIWQTSASLALKKPLLGYGADTIVAVFPQNDVVGKYNALGSPSTMIDKPHNMFIQITLYQGLLGLCIFLLIVLSLLTSLIRIYIATSNPLALPSLAASIGYLTVGLANDSKVYGSVFFWILIGLSIRSIRESQVK